MEAIHILHRLIGGAVCFELIFWFDWNQQRKSCNWRLSKRNCPDFHQILDLLLLDLGPAGSSCRVTSSGWTSPSGFFKIPELGVILAFNRIQFHWLCCQKQFSLALLLWKYKTLTIRVIIGNHTHFHSVLPEINVWLSEPWVAVLLQVWLVKA